MESNHNPRLRKPVYYPLYYAGKIGCGGSIRNFWVELMRLTDRLNPRNTLVHLTGIEPVYFWLQIQLVNHSSA